MAQETWLITGGCGFIGSRLVAELRRRPGVALRVFDNLSVGTQEDLARVAPVVRVDAGGELPAPDAGAVQLVVGDIVDYEALARAVRGTQVVVHLAANTGVGPSVEDPRQDCVTNVIGTFNALEASRQAGVGRFVFASSGAPIGEVVPPIHEELAPHPVSPYGASKLAGEGYCSAYARTFGLHTVALRFGNVYGPGSGHKSSVVAKFIRDAMEGRDLHIYGDGRQTRDFIYIGDLVEAILAAAGRSDIGGEVFQIATARETTVGEIAELMCKVLPEHGIKAPRVVHEAARLGDVMRNFSDTTKARERLGWQARTGVVEGIGLTVRWFQDPQR